MTGKSLVTPERIAAEAAQVRFLPFVLGLARALLMAVFTTIGWIFGSLWFGAVYCAFAVYYGFLKGAHAPMPEPKAPSMPQ